MGFLLRKGDLPREFTVESDEPPWPYGWHDASVGWGLFQVLAVGNLGNGDLVVVSGGVLDVDDGPNLIRCHWPGGAWFMRRHSDTDWKPEYLKTGSLPIIGGDVVRDIWEHVMGAFERGSQQADEEGLL